MKKIFAVIAFSVSICFSLCAVTVNEQELKSAAEKDVIVFENYSGPHSVIETVSAINGIGTDLGKELTDLAKPYSTVSNPKYQIIHAVTPEKGKLDADIFILLPQAGVDHIKNLRRIIASYLSAAYGYKNDDAMTIATFITVYNAVYRGNTDYFSTKYKDDVLKYLDKSKAGLSIKWSEWAGNTQIVIPLGDYTEGGLSSVDTSIISDKNVVESMKEDDDKGIDERKNMVDIKEREAEIAEDKARDAAKTAAEENKKLEEQKAAQKEAENQAEEAKKLSEENPDDEELKAKAEEAEKTAEEERQKTEEQTQKTQDARETAEEKQKEADRKNAESHNERNDIAKDQQKLIEEQMKLESEGTVIGLKVDEKTLLSTMVKINAKTGKIIKESPVKVIRGRTILPVQDVVYDITTGVAFNTNSGATSTFYMAICGEKSGKSAVKLCLIDPFRMEIQAESKETLSENSLLVCNGTHYYAVIEEGKNYYIACFDKTLELKSRSTEKVSPSTPITITPQGIIVNLEEGTPAILKITDLTLISQ